VVATAVQSDCGVMLAGVVGGDPERLWPETKNPLSLWLQGVFSVPGSMPIHGAPQTLAGKCGR